jgi:hypothetical protein
MDTEIIQPNKEVLELTSRARDAWGALRKSHEHWLAIGHAINGFKRQLDAEIRNNDPDNPGQQWKESMGAYLRTAGFHESCPEGIDRAVRTNLQHIIDHLPEVKQYRQTLAPKERLRQNNPNATWRSFLASPLGEKYRPAPPPPPPPPPIPDPIKKENNSKQPSPMDKRPGETVYVDEVAEMIDAMLAAGLLSRAPAEPVPVPEAEAEILKPKNGQNKSGEPDPLWAVLRHSLAAGHLDDAREALAALEHVHVTIPPVKNYSQTAETITGPPLVMPLEFPTVSPTEPMTPERKETLLSALNRAVHNETTTREALDSLRAYRARAQGLLPSQIWGKRKPIPPIMADSAADDTVAGLRERTEQSIRDTDEMIEELQRRQDANWKAWNQMNEDYAALEKGLEGAKADRDRYRERAAELEAEVAQLKGIDFKTATSQHGEFRIHSEPLDEAFERVDCENQKLRAEIDRVSESNEQAIELLRALYLRKNIFHYAAEDGPRVFHEAGMFLAQVYPEIAEEMGVEKELEEN